MQNLREAGHYLSDSTGGTGVPSLRNLPILPGLLSCQLNTATGRINRLQSLFPYQRLNEPDKGLSLDPPSCATTIIHTRQPKKMVFDIQDR